MAADPLLAVFLDRTSMRHERLYPHPIQRVWEAVSTSEHLDVWLLPVSRVDARLGGACSFSWGGPAEQSVHGSVTRFEPPNVIEYSLDVPGSCLLFELLEEEGGTRLFFTQSFASGEGTDLDGGQYPGSDLPGGPNTPWRPGFVAGFHEMLDELALFLRGKWSADDRAAQLAGGDHSMHETWIAIYRNHIARQGQSGSSGVASSP